jgi:hypothetical protein
MKNVMTHDNIRRLITNQMREYAPHPFRGSGMVDFSQLYPVLRSLPPQELAEWMQLIDTMRATHGDCPSCPLKILAFSALFTLERLPELSLEYTKLYDEGIERVYRPPGPGRNYMGEVLDAINNEGGRAISTPSPGA